MILVKIFIIFFESENIAPPWGKVWKVRGWGIE